MNPCTECATSAGSCCRNRQIVLTGHDVERIQDVTGNADFYVYEIPEPSYANQEDDPIWNVVTQQQDGSRRILKKRSNGDCFFLSPDGCTLNFDVRPLLCKIHPYHFVETELLGIDADCPISRMPNSALVLQKMRMPVSQVEAWRRQLYHELVIEKAKSVSDLAASIAPELANPTV